MQMINMQMLRPRTNAIRPVAPHSTGSSDMYRLSKSFPYLIARLGIRTGDLFARVIKRDGLSLQMYRVLAALTEEDRPLRLGELAALTSADLSTLSRVVADLHRRGVLLRQRPEHDQRSLQVSLTDQGRMLAARYMPVAAHFEQLATTNLSSADTQALKDILRQLYENLDLIEAKVSQGEIDAIIEGTEKPGSRKKGTAAKTRK
ncbi:MarR family winged helix-turn-helix transcriptional regulator [Tardiphaga sp.]|uniref:MarR family winged helix-turn-helix transcriptional regulator n=1 Tax=Tardiphaga sp. TaxID=1926292 RepID=UPI00352A794C